MKPMSSGSPNAKIALVGEAPGAEEEIKGKPFVGGSGKELTRMLTQAGIQRSDCYILNTFNVRPPSNKIDLYFKTKASAKKSGDTIVESLGPRKSGSTKLFLLSKYKEHVDQLKKSLTESSAEIIIPLGGTANWALTGESSIAKARGYLTHWKDLNDRPRKLLPTYHPAAILRMWSNRIICLLDLIKAREILEGKRKPLERQMIINPTLKEIKEFFDQHLKNADYISFDIETKNRQITKISFAPSPQIGICIPFVDESKPGNSYWKATHIELAAWNWVRKILALPAIKIAQNGMYDVQYLWQLYGIPTANFTEDTMLMHYALMPEMQKSLGFMGSIYCNELNWKELRTPGTTAKKADD